MVGLEDRVLNVMRYTKAKELRDKVLKEQTDELVQELLEALIKIRMSQYVDALIKEGKLKVDKPLILITTTGT